ncbi:MAG: MCE family protein [Flavobacteriales bacterium]|nr:MCE family protein [Flavobacteriales bacterium]
MKREVIIGFVAIVAVGALIFGLFYLKGENLFSNNRTFHTTYQSVDGLVGASPVKISGLQVGVVTKLEMNPDDPSLVDVYFIIDNADINIPSSSIAILESDLLGTKSINLKLGTDTKMLKNGEFVLAQVQTDLTDMVNEQLLPLKLKTEELIATIDSTVTIVKSVIGNNTENLNQSFIGLREAIESFGSMSNRLDTLVKRQAGRIATIFSDVASITSNLKKSNEAITTLVSNAVDITDSIKKMEIVETVNQAKMAFVQVNQVLTSINNSNGTLYKLMNDSTMYTNINVMIDQATQLVENIQAHPNRYLQFAVFGSKDTGLGHLSRRNEKALREFAKKDSILKKYK